MPGADRGRAAVIATVIVMFAELIFSKFEYKMLDSSRDVNIYIEYSNAECLSEIITYLKELNIKILDIEITKSATEGKRNPCAIFSLQLNKKTKLETILSDLTKINDVISVEEL